MSQLLELVLQKCDGQILVTEDILGMTNLKSKFIKKYLDFNNLATSAIKSIQRIG